MTHSRRVAIRLDVFAILVLGISCRGWCFEEPSKHPIPDDNARRVAAMRIRTAFRAEQRKKTTADRLALAKELLKTVADESNDPAAQYELLSQAKQLVVDAGDSETAFEAVGEMTRLFAVEDAKLRLETISSLAANTRIREQLLVLVVHAFALAENAICDVDLETAKKVLTLGVGIAKRGNNLVLADYGNSRIKELALSRNRIEQVREAKELLQRDPNNLGAASAVGEFLCLVAGDLATGLPLLAKSSDQTLKSLAEKELANPKDVAPQLELAKGWWNLSESASQPEKVQYQRLAKRWYLKALPHMSGIEQANLKTRIAQIPSQLGVIHCRVIVDGRDDLIFSATQVELRHHAWNVPPSVTLNNQHRWNPRIAATFPNSGKTQFLPNTTDFSKASLVKLRGRGSVRVVPANDNATIQLDDGDLGADVYEFVLICGIGS